MEELWGNGLLIVLLTYCTALIYVEHTGQISPPNLSFPPSILWQSCRVFFGGGYVFCPTCCFLVVMWDKKKVEEMPQFFVGVFVMLGASHVVDIRVWMS